MFELLVLGTLVLAVLFVLGVVGSILGIVLWAIVLPFKLLGLVFRGVAFVLLLPFLMLAGLIGLMVFGIGLLSPALPFLLLIAGLIWLARRRHHTPPAGQH